MRPAGSTLTVLEDRMSCVIGLAMRNVAERTGGPHGAAAFELATGRPVAGGVDLVPGAGCSSAQDWQRFVFGDLGTAVGSVGALAPGGVTTIRDVLRDGAIVPLQASADLIGVSPDAG
jgi:hypothetical protein